MLAFQKEVGNAIAGVNTDTDGPFTLVLQVNGEKMEMTRQDYNSLVEAVAQLEISLDQGRKMFA